MRFKHRALHMSAWIFGALAPASLAQGAGEPPLVAAYVDQLAQQCQSGMSTNAARALVDRIDLNGDKVVDWVVDAGRFPCPTRSKAFADQGQQVTVFVGRENGQALPAFQRSAFGANLERRSDGRYTLSVNLSGGDCGVVDAKVRCARQLIWLANERRFDLAAVSLAGPQSRESGGLTPLRP